jgi:hypothetical protein
MKNWKHNALLISLLLATFVGLRAHAQTTTVADTVYRADGTPAAGTLLLDWGAFTTAGGESVAAGSTSVTLGAGGALSIALAPNADATPMGSYYTVVYHLNDGTTSREFWVVPVTVPGGGPAKLAAIRNEVLPTSVAMQTVSKQYVDNAIAGALIAPIPLDASPYVLKAGDTMTGPLVLSADPASADQAADKNYVDESVAESVASISAGAITSGTIGPARLPLFGPSGTTHAPGMVPDPGPVAGDTHFLREDGTWSAPASSGGSTSGAASGDLSGSYPAPTVDAVESGTIIRGIGGSVNGYLDFQALYGAAALLLYHNGTDQYGWGLTIAGQQFFLGTGGQYFSWNQGTGGLQTLGANEYMRLSITSGSAAALTLPGYGRFAWGSGNSATAPDTGLSRIAAGVVGVGNGNAGDVSGTIEAAQYVGPASAPAGACVTNGAWVFSQDGHAAFCASGTWVTKI